MPILTRKWKSLSLPRVGKSALQRSSFGRKAIEERKDKRGHRRCYDTSTGRQVKCPEREGGGGARKPRARKQPQRGGVPSRGTELTPGIDDNAIRLQEAVASGDRDSIRSAWQQFEGSTNANEIRKMARALGVEDKDDVDVVIRRIKEKIRQTTSSTGGVSVRPPLPPVEAVQEAYQFLQQYPQYQHGLIGMGELFQVIRRRNPDMTREEFQQTVRQLIQSGRATISQANAPAQIPLREYGFRNPDGSLDYYLTLRSKPAESPRLSSEEASFAMEDVFNNRYNDPDLTDEQLAEEITRVVSGMGAPEAIEMARRYGATRDQVRSRQAARDQLVERVLRNRDMWLKLNHYDKKEPPSRARIRNVPHKPETL